MHSNQECNDTYTSIVTGRLMPKIYLTINEASLEYYRFHFQDDGYPAKRMDDDTVWEHPIYPVYVLGEYLEQYRRNPSDDLKENIKMVARAALTRARPFRNALVYWYEGKESVARSVRKHYSGLTQAYYFKIFNDLAQIFGEQSYAGYAERFFNSLTIPVEEGGVARSFGTDGCGIEELPLDQPDLILNGWLSAMVQLTFHDRDGSVRSFLNKNLDLLEKLLPKYDCEWLENSRYSLSGFIYLRMVAEKVKGSLFNLILFNPMVFFGNDQFSLADGKCSSRWSNYVFNNDFSCVAPGVYLCDKKVGRMNLVLSQFGERNVLSFRIQASEPVQMRLEAYVGEYLPIYSSQSNCQWIPFWRGEIGALPKDIRVEIPEKIMRLVGSPTNFTKMFKGRRRNVYHIIHIQQLARLYRYSQRDIFKAYATKWWSYVKNWSVNPIYNDVCQSNYMLDAQSRAIAEGWI